MKSRTFGSEYDEARRAFEPLRIEEKAIFLVEAAITTLARGLDQAGQTLADELDRAFRRAHDAPADATGDAAPDAETDDPEAPPRARRRKRSTPPPGTGPDAGPVEG